MCVSDIFSNFNKKFINYSTYHICKKCVTCRIRTFWNTLLPIFFWLTLKNIFHFTQFCMQSYLKLCKWGFLFLPLMQIYGYSILFAFDFPCKCLHNELTMTIAKIIAKRMLRMADEGWWWIRCFKQPYHCIVQFIMKGESLTTSYLG